MSVRARKASARRGASRIAVPVAAAAAAASAGALLPARAGVIELTPVKDNTLFESATGGVSNGAGNSIFAGTSGPFGGDTIRRGLLAFDVAGSLPADATITGADLTLYLMQASALGDPARYGLRRVLSDWGEGTSSSGGGGGAPATPGDATWLHTFFPDRFWSTPGGDFDGATSASQTVSTDLGYYSWGSTPQLIGDVQSWLDDPGSNFGWVLAGVDETLGFTGLRFGSREAPAAQVPVLRIEYEVPCAADCGDHDGAVGIRDLLALLAAWGGTSPCDFDGDGVDRRDLVELISEWGACP